MRYKANPVEVNAFTIVKTVARDDGDGMDVTLDNDDVKHATKAMTSRMTPEVGDYWVTQIVDGYEYLNPKKTFERKYSKVNP